MTIERVRVLDILRGRAKEGAIRLLPYDVVSILPLDYVRVWVTGAVARTGQYRLREGVDVYQALAEAGGLDPKLGVPAEDVRILLRRGPESVTVLPAKRDPGAKPMPLEAGDEIIVEAPKQVRVTVGGEVGRPGEVVLREGTPVLTAISQGGGATREGTLQGVLVQRKGEWLQIDAAAAPTPGSSAFLLEDGDYVYVRKNERAVVAVGQVRNPGRILFEDNKTYRVLDVVAAAGGATDRGSYFRVYLGRPGADGKLQVRQLRLDKFVAEKGGGDPKDNPEVQPGDVVWVGEPKGLGTRDIGAVLSGALGIFSFLRL
jgi:protein involved in polysaccharide export with SLBB domain